MDRETIIRRLVESLSDKELRRIFPQTTPDGIRDILLQRKKVRNLRKIKKSPSGNIPGEPGQQKCALYTDGASRGNPGPAGAGAVLVDQKGREIAARAEYLGRCTNNAAEYRALVMGLQMAVENGCSELDIFLDSELIVRQLTGRYKVKNATLKPLFGQAQQLLQCFKNFSVTHVPRAKNQRADQLANQGIDGRAEDD